MPEAQPRDGLPGEVFKRNVEALAVLPPNKGGIMSPEKYKSLVVNIRPPKWDEKFWIGRITNYVDAQFIADAVFYYTGQTSVHLKGVNFQFPPLECTDRGVSTLLTSRDMCSKYASSIAKGSEFKPQRSNFLKKVKALVLKEVKSVGVQNLLLRFRDAANPVDRVAENDCEDEEEEDDGEVDQAASHPTPMEVDEHAGQAAHVAQLVASSQSGPNRNVDGRTVHVPSFGLDGPRFTLQSDVAPVDGFSWDMEAYLDSFMTSDDLEYSLTSLNSDEQDLCGATGDAETSSCDPTQCPSALENFDANFFAMVDAGVDSVNWQTHSIFFLINNHG